MVSANYNSNDLLIEKIDSLIKINDQIFSEFNISMYSLNNISDLLSKVLNQNSLIDHNVESQTKNTLNLIQKIRTNIFYIKNQDLLKIFDLADDAEKSILKREFTDIATSSNTIINKLKLFNEQLSEKIQENSLLVSDKEIHISNDYTNFLKNIPNFQYELLSILNYILNKTEIVKSEFNNIKETNESLENINDFQKDLSLLIKEYSNNINSLTNKFEKDYKKFELDYDKISKSTNLLNEGVDNGLKNLADLNTKVQKVELEFSKLLNSQNNFIKAELDKVKLKLLNDVELIILDAKEKSESITVQEIEIKNSHNDFIKLVEKAGIYELTQNYKSKADEEKIEYKAFRKYTTWSILAAVAFTLAVFIFAFFENSGNTNPPNYLILISRLSISAMFFILALYLSKQAAKHYESYQENHRTFLQLAALEPFMARMSEEEQKEIRKGLIPSYFNQNSDGKFAAKNDEVDMSMMFTFMDKLSNFGQPKKDTKVVESTAVETK